MRRAFLAAGIVLVAAAIARADDLPENVKRLAPASGTGEVLVYESADARSATALLGAALDAVKPYLGERPRELAGAVDPTDTKVQEGLALDASGKAGLALVFCGAKGGVAFVIDDTAEGLKTSFPGLLALAKAHVQGDAKPIAWKDLDAPGQGTLRAPEGWTITGAVSGMIDAKGPQGEVHLGLNAPVYTPDANAPPTVLTASYGDPVQTVKDLYPVFSKMSVQAGGPEYKFGNVIETADGPEGFDGLAKFIHYDGEQTQDGKTEKFEVLAFVNTVPVGQNEFMYYTSYVSAPKERFAESLPVLIEIWGHWKTDPEVFAKRMHAALAALDAANKAVQEATVYRAQATDKAAEDWDEYIRGYSTVTGPDGKHVDVANGDVKAVIDHLNERDGAGSWKPLRER